MNGLIPTLRLALRRDRMIVPAWSIVFVLMPLATVATTRNLYPTQQSVATATLMVDANPSMVALFGPVHAATFGALSMIKMTVFASACLGLFTGLLVIRHTRSEEDTGRRELLCAGPVDRTADLIAALIEAVVVSLGIGLVVAAGLIANGMSTPGSVAFGATWALVGIVFAALAAFCAQLASDATLTRVVFGAVLAVSYLLRGVADLEGVPGAAHPSPLWAIATWSSPLGIAQQVHPFAGNAWAPVLILGCVAVVLGTVALGLSVGRDLGSGVLRRDTGRPTASWMLPSSMGLVVRLQRATISSATPTFLACGVVFGGMASAVDAMAMSPGGQEMMARIGGSGPLTSAFYAAVFMVMAVIATAVGVGIANRFAAEERAGRAEFILATPVRRWSWYGAHAVAALGGAIVLCGVTGIGATLIVGHDVVWAAIGAAPAALLIVSVGLLAAGVSPRLAPIAWGALGLCIVAFAAQVLGLPSWIGVLSPFDHIVSEPGRAVFTWAAVSFTLCAAAIASLGAVVFARRDVNA